MKPFFRLLLFLLLASIFDVSGQSTEKIAIPILKEGKKIDQLMDLVLNSKNKDRFERDNNLTDSCFMMNFFKNGNDYFSIEIERISKPVTNTLINGMEIDKNHVGYFQYRKYKIFVWADVGFFEFFNKTSQTKTFNFIYKLQNPEPLGNSYFSAMWHYQYKNGYFSVEGPPAVKELGKD